MAGNGGRGEGVGVGLTLCGRRGLSDLFEVYSDLLQGVYRMNSSNQGGGQGRRGARQFSGCRTQSTAQDPKKQFACHSCFGSVVHRVSKKEGVGYYKNGGSINGGVRLVGGLILNFAATSLQKAKSKKQTICGRIGTESAKWFRGKLQTMGISMFVLD